MSEKLDKLRASLEKEKERRIKIHRFGNGIGFLACLFSLEQGHHVSITTLNVYSGDTTQKISPSFSVYDFSFSIGFPSAR